jgi:hypothetical protein
MTFKHCKNPDCQVCNFRDEHPSEDRLQLIFAASNALRLLIELDAECISVREKIKGLTDILGIPDQDVDDIIPYEQVVQQCMVHRFKSDPNLMNQIQAMLEVCMALLPKDVVQHAEILVCKRVAELAEKREVSDAKVTKVLTEVEGFMKAVRATGQEYLAGDDHSHPHTIQ